MLSSVSRVLVIMFLTVAALAAGAGTASAHAQIEGSDPAPGSVLSSPPDRVTLTFGEAVEPTPGAVQVFDDHLVRVDQDDSGAADPDGYQLGVSLRPGLPAGTYTVSWRVSATDTHPVSGTFTYSVGTASTVTAAPPSAAGDPAVGPLLAVSRGLGYVGLALGPGALLVLLLLWPAGIAVRDVRRLLGAGFATLLLGTVSAMLLEGVLASGVALSTLWSDPGSLDTRSERFDLLHSARLYLLLAVGAVVVVAGQGQVVAARSRRRGGRPPEPDPRRRQVLLAAAGAGTLALLGTWTFAGHAAVGLQSPVAIVADLAHLAAMAVWVGGLCLLVVGLRPGSGASAQAAAVLPRFSRIAFGAVVVLVVTGTYQSWRQVGSVPALFDTTYGWLLLGKLSGVVVLVALGNRARQWVQRHDDPSRERLLSPVLVAHASTAPTSERPHPELHEPAPSRLDPAAPDPVAVATLRRGLLAEVGIAAGVLAVTAVLVAAVPARQDHVASFEQAVSAPACPSGWSSTARGQATAPCT